jgi:hypothetical protein
VRHAIVADVGPSETVWTPEMVIGVVETVVVGAAPSPAPAGADEDTVPVEIGPDAVADSDSDRSGVKAITSVWTCGAAELVDPVATVRSGEAAAVVAVVTGRATRPGLRFASR